jgi:hypothetical protein
VQILHFVSGSKDQAYLEIRSFLGFPIGAAMSECDTGSVKGSWKRSIWNSISGGRYCGRQTSCLQVNRQIQVGLPGNFSPDLKACTIQSVSITICIPILELEIGNFGLIVKGYLRLRRILGLQLLCNAGRLKPFPITLLIWHHAKRRI